MRASNRNRQPDLLEAADFILKGNKMKIFLDSANVKEIEKWLCYGIVDGVTTNPSIMLKDGIYNIEEGVIKLAKLITPLPLSAEVTPTI